jgi:hypothetical protein
MKDIFISHAWGKDELDRDNHERCKLIAEKLIINGYTVWIDSNEMYGNIDSSIMKGINNCKIVLVCLTRKYCDKINNCAVNQLTNDNCYKEWNYSLFKQKIIIPVLMEPSMINHFLENEGIIQMYLNSLMFVDFTKNLNDDFDMLCKYLKRNNILNFNEKKFYSGNSNSFNNFVQSITGVSIKSVSPRTIKKLRKNFFSSKNLINKKNILTEKINILKYKSKKLNATIYI